MEGYTFGFPSSPIPAYHDEDDCDICHENHDARMNYGKQGFNCCTEFIDDRLSVGEWCEKKPLEHGDIYLAGRTVGSKFILFTPIKCLECERENKFGPVSKG